MKIAGGLLILVAEIEGVFGIAGSMSERPRSVTSANWSAPVRPHAREEWTLRQFIGGEVDAPGQHRTEIKSRTTPKDDAASTHSLLTRLIL
ncbi:hypothetical protein HNQ36_001038 [Afipia massiliensis]|uniref:Uncharacterized protein n=1 Tax=Afipia massiliensis TaxID=211460 RepID=A0A840MXE4_9BRAD|nr:hypothetical protein [Afipia massiliensis]